MADAEKSYRRAIQERPTFVLALLNLGRVLINQQRYAESGDALISATQARPDSADAHFLLGKTYLKLKPGSKAVPHLNEAIRLDPEGKADAHLLLAALYAPRELRIGRPASTKSFWPSATVAHFSGCQPVAR